MGEGELPAHPTYLSFSLSGNVISKGGKENTSAKDFRYLDFHYPHANERLSLNTRKTARACQLILRILRF